MKITRNQKRLTVALGVALAALVADRIMPSPKPLAAESTDLLVRPSAEGARRSSAAQPATPENKPAAHRWGAPGVHARLSALATQQPPTAVGRDPFHFERPRISVRPIEPSAPDTARRISAAEQFAARHQLRAIIGTGRGGLVLVSDRMIRVGEGLDGWRLVHISRDAATFENDGIRVILPLSDSKAEDPAVK